MSSKIESQVLAPERTYRLVFNDGKAMSGKLIQTDKYTLVIDVAGDQGQQRLLVYKHAIKYIVLGVVQQEG
jgi:sRNA-binding regulator protein Hfq